MNLLSHADNCYAPHNFNVLISGGSLLSKKEKTGKRKTCNFPPTHDYLAMRHIPRFHKQPHSSAVNNADTSVLFLV